MRISDWSSDVCSSDLVQRVRGIDDRDPRRLLEAQVGAAQLDMQRAAVIIGGIVQEDGAADVGAQLAVGQRNIGRVRVQPIIHPRRIARQQRRRDARRRSEEHTSELQSLMRISYAVFCLKKTNRMTYVKSCK